MVLLIDVSCSKLINYPILKSKLAFDKQVTSIVYVYFGNAPVWYVRIWVYHLTLELREFSGDLVGNFIKKRISNHILSKEWD